MCYVAAVVEFCPIWLQNGSNMLWESPTWPQDGQQKTHTATLPLSHCHYHTATLPLSHCHMSKPQHNYHCHYHTATTVLSTPPPHHHHHHHPYSHHCQSPHHSMLSANTTYTQHMHHLWAMSEPSCTSPFTHSLKHSHATTSGKCSARSVCVKESAVEIWYSSIMPDTYTMLLCCQTWT